MSTTKWSAEGCASKNTISHYLSGNFRVKVAVPRLEFPDPMAVTVIWYEWLPLGGLGGE
jgi:hypothetical protein